MEFSIELIVDYLVGLSGFVVWMLFIPQLRLLYKVKESKSNSIWFLGLSLLLQVLILIQAYFNQNWSLVFANSVSATFVLLTIVFILYYRWYPGGRGREEL